MKQLLPLLLFTLSALCALSQPAYDDCAGLIDLGVAPICPIPDTFNNVNATQSVVFSTGNDNIPSCFTGGTVDRDVWFSFLVPPDGSIIDFTVVVTGVEGPNGMMNQPQVAVYRGECLLDELQELDCATSAPGIDSVEINLFGLTPGLPYFLRISDWTPSGTPNWGDFVLCVKEYEPVFNICDVGSSEACTGTLYDSGGPDDVYQNGESCVFTLCPQEFHQCLFINIQSFELENSFDFLTFFAGDDINAPLMDQFTGFGSGIELQAFSTCVTVQFTSDGSVIENGFELTWFCSPDTCTIPPPSTCDNPTVIGSLPYVGLDLSTCYAGNEILNSPCNNSGFLNDEDYIFTYQSPGDECIAVSITGSAEATGVGIFDDCPNQASDCIAVSGGNFGQADPTINAAFLEEPGTYYIVVDNANNCTAFNIEVTSVNCPVVFPTAADCEDALSLNGCGDLPAIVSVAPGLGDPGFLVPGVNDGCWGFFDPPNFTFFFFTAQADGEFAFIMESADPNEASDIDFQVWGPITPGVSPCDYCATTEPARSSYAAGADPTGLANIHPINGSAIMDVCEDAGGDDFVRKIDVLEGETYVVLVNDFGGVIVSGAVAIDFGGTTAGVLDALGTNFYITQDTAVCPGNAAQLLATGGEIYQWFPAAGLSCVYCNDPVATITGTTTYSVAINSLCHVDTLDVEVGLLAADAGADQTVCLGEEIQIFAGSNFTDIAYEWTGPAGFLSCTDCADPVLTALTAGTFTFTVLVSGPNCSFSDAMTLTVLPSPAPVYQINDDQQICVGETVPLGGTATPGVTYIWTSDPAGFTSGSANPSVTPPLTITYYLEATNADCPLSSFDSVTVTVSELPVILLAADTTICLEESTVLADIEDENGVVYTWTPPAGLDDANSANPVATPSQTTTYTLVAEREGCIAQGSMTVEVVQIAVEIVSEDTFGICSGASVNLLANPLPPGNLVTWAPNNGSLNVNTGLAVIATPLTATLYTATVQVGGCVKIDSAYVGVDSLPWNTVIMPIDTIVCEGELVLLTSPVYEPGDFQQIDFQWTPSDYQITPDSFYNMVVQPAADVTYTRIATNGFCVREDTVHITVISTTSIVFTPDEPLICAGGSVPLTATSPVPIDFTWEPATGLSCTECSDPIASPPTTTTYSVTGDYEGCPVGGSITVEVVQPPLALFPANVICPGESSTLNTGPNGNWDYVWTSDPPGLNDNTPAPTVSPSETTTYFVSIDNGICPLVEQSFTLFVAVDTPLEITEDTLVCDGMPVSLTADGGNPGVYTWQPGGSNQPTFPPVLQIGTNTFVVTFTDNGGCFTHTDSVTVEVVEGIQIIEIVENQPDTVYQGTEISLGVETSIPAASWIWSNGSTTDTALVTALNVDGETYSVTVTDDLGCTDTEAVNHTVLPSLFNIPNVFSPNGDELNQNFHVIISGENVEVLSIKVWSRWGQLMYEEKNGNIGWDGTFKKEPAASDVYVYKIVLTRPDGTEYSEAGDLTLVR